MGTVHRTMQGKVVDMDKLMRQNEMMPAIGNVRVNARGDELGPGGTIIKKREDIMAEYYETNPKAKAKMIKPVETIIQPVTEEYIPGLDQSPIIETTKTKKTSTEE